MLVNHRHLPPDKFLVREERLTLSENNLSHVDVGKMNCLSLTGLRVISNVWFRCNVGCLSSKWERIHIIPWTEKLEHKHWEIKSRWVLMVKKLSCTGLVLYRTPSRVQQTFRAEDPEQVIDTSCNFLYDIWGWTTFVEEFCGGSGSMEEIWNPLLEAVIHLPGWRSLRAPQGRTTFPLGSISHVKSWAQHLRISWQISNQTGSKQSG